MPSPAMTVLEDFLLLDGIPPTTAFAVELWENYSSVLRNGSISRAGMSSLLESGDWVIDIDTFTDGERYSTVCLHRNLNDNIFEDHRSGCFPATERGLVDMVAELRVQRRLAEQGMCACDVRLKALGADVCSLCFLKRTSRRALG